MCEPSYREGPKWIVREPYVPVPGTYVSVTWGCWRTSLLALHEEGWKIEIVTNLFSKTAWLYVRDPESGQMGRALYRRGWGCLQLQFLCQEKNKRVKPPRIWVNNDQDIEMEEIEFHHILEVMRHIQERDLRKKRKPRAEIVDLQSYIEELKDAG